MRWRRRLGPGDGPGGRSGGGTPHCLSSPRCSVWIEGGLALKRGAGDGEEAVSDGSHSSGVTVALGSEGSVPNAAAQSVAPGGSTRSAQPTTRRNEARTASAVASTDRGAEAVRPALEAQERWRRRPGPGGATDLAGGGLGGGCGRTGGANETTACPPGRACVWSAPLVDRRPADRFGGPWTRSRRGAGAVERGGLENRWARKRPQGSNPCLSAKNSS